MKKDMHEDEQMSRLKRNKHLKNNKHFGLKNTHVHKGKNLTLLPQSNNESLTLKQKINRSIRYQVKAKPAALLLGALILFGLVWALDYVHNDLLVSNKNVSLTSKKSDRFQMTLVGDMMMARGNQRQADHLGYNHFFQKSKYLWQDSDLVMGNLESAIITDRKKVKENPDTNIHLLMDPKGASAMKDAGFTTLGTANNHVGDYGKSGIRQELNYLKKNNIDFVGIGSDTSEALKYQTYNVNDVKISVVAVTDVIPDHTSVQQNAAGALTTKNNDYLNLIKEASAHSDYTIVYSHGGFENGLTVTERQKELDKKMVDSGADLVVGAHAHVLQPISKYKNALILNGMGNFIFEQEQSRTKDAVVANLRMTQKGKMKLELIPMRIKDGVPTVTKNLFYQQRIFHQLTKNLPQRDYHKVDQSVIMDNFGYNYRFE